VLTWRSGKILRGQNRRKFTGLIISFGGQCQPEGLENIHQWCAVAVGSLYPCHGFYVRSWVHTSPTTPVARLNITADELASTAYDSSTFEEHVPIAPGVGAHLEINGKTVVSKYYRSTSRDIRRTQNIKAWIKEKQDWNG
jgi:hypothetical protein